MDGKKISFGFSKITKKPNLLANKPASKEDQKVELIKCMEGQEIKLVEEKPEEAPLVIPLKENQKTSSALLSLIKRRAVLLGEEAETPTSEEQKPEDGVNLLNGKAAVADTLEQRAAKELLAALKVNGESVESTQLVLPVVKADDLPLDGAKESTLDDYESIPIQQFGVAMLRGMGWVAPPPKKGGAPVDEAPLVRPKGMGLGADKALKAKPLLVPPEANEVLEIKKQAFVRILGGKHKDLYGQIEGFDDHAGRVIVKMAIGSTKEAFNEFLCQPVSRKEYAEYGKCINTAKYEEYKKLENEHGQIIIKKEKLNEEKARGKEENAKYLKREEIDSRYCKQDIKAERDVKSYNLPKEERRRGERQDSERFRAKHQQEDSKRKLDGYSNYTTSHTSRRHDILDTNQSAEGGVQRRSRSADRQTQKSRSSNMSRHSRHHRAASSDSSISSQTEGDSDSAYERKHKKSKSKRKSKKCKSKTRKHTRHDDSSAENSAASAASTEEAAHKHHKSHKKKTKKSKKQRSRSRSRSRARK